MAGEKEKLQRLYGVKSGRSSSVKPRRDQE